MASEAKLRREQKLREMEEKEAQEEQRRWALEQKREENIRRRTLENELLLREHARAEEYEKLRRKQLEIKRLENLQRREALRVRRLAQEDLKKRALEQLRAVATLETVASVESRVLTPRERKRDSTAIHINAASNEENYRDTAHSGITGSGTSDELVENRAQEIGRTAQQEGATAPSDPAGISRHTTAPVGHVVPETNGPSAIAATRSLSSSVNAEISEPSPQEVLVRKQELIRQYEEELEKLRLEEKYIAQGLKLDMNQYVEEKYEIVKETKREEEKRVEEIKEQERAQKAGLLPPTFPVRKGTTVEQATNAATQIQKVYRGHLGRLEAEMEGKLRRMEMQIRREEDRIREIYTKISDAKATSQRSEYARRDWMSEKSISKAMASYQQQSSRTSVSKNEKRLQAIYGVPPLRPGNGTKKERSVAEKSHK